MDLSTLSNNGFDSLQTVMARRNLISRLSLCVPSLIELNLAYNALRVMPSLGGLPHLEVLILSHNQLHGSLENLKSSMRIKRLDLAYNKFDWSPSQLSQALDAMSHLRSLENLRLYRNKFVACFKEYQIYVVSRLPSLQKLDDCIITTQMRDNIAATDLLALDIYDPAFKKRQEELARRQGMRDDLHGMKGGAGGVGKLKLIMESLEEVLEEPEVLASAVALVRDNAAKRAQCHAAFNIEEAFWDGMENGSKEEMLITVSYILELITAVMERHDTSRGQLVDSLGFLSCVVTNDLGRRCLDLLRRMMLSSDQCREEAGRGVKSIVVKRISKALSGSAKAIQGINTKFDLIDEHVQKMMEFNRATNSKVNKVLTSFERLDDTFNDRAEMLLESLVGATNTLTEVLEAAAVSLDKVNIRQELDNIPKAMITLAIPFVILVIELAVSNAYLGILLASLPSVSLKYSNYLIAYASATLMGLFLSLMWLVCYRVWLSTSCQGKIYSNEVKKEATLQKLSELRTGSQSFGDLSIFSDSTMHDQDPKPAEAVELDVSSPANFARLSSPKSTSSQPVGVSWAKARRMERKRERASSQNDEMFDSGSEKPYPSPVTTPLIAPAVPLNLPPLQEVFQSVPDQQDTYDDRFSGAAVALQHAQELAATAAEHLATGTLPDVEPLSAEVPDESQGYQSYQSSRDGPDLQENAEKGKRSMVQMRWNSFENPFNMDVTWGRKGEGVKNVKDVKDGGAAEVSQSSQGQTAEGDQNHLAGLIGYGARQANQGRGMRPHRRVAPYDADVVSSRRIFDGSTSAHCQAFGLYHRSGGVFAESGFSRFSCKVYLALGKQSSLR
eukprot:symbB.v1.2.008461.t1/scaffold474.1/size199077/4